jgi:hypothetical protein
VPPPRAGADGSRVPARATDDYCAALQCAALQLGLGPRRLQCFKNGKHRRHVMPACLFLSTTLRLNCTFLQPRPTADIETLSNQIVCESIRFADESYFGVAALIAQLHYQIYSLKLIYDFVFCSDTASFLTHIVSNLELNITIDATRLGLFMDNPEP